MDKYIYVNRTYLSLPNYIVGECSKLENMIRIFDKVYFKHKDFVFFYNDETKELRIPTGCNVDYISHLTGREIIYKDGNYNKYDKISVNFTGTPKNEDQKTYVRFLCGLDEFSDISGEKQLLLNSETGEGKTFSTLATISMLQLKPLIIVDEVDIIHVWMNEIKKFMTNITEDEIFIIQGKPSVNKLLKMKSKEINQKKFFLASVQTLTNIDDLNDFLIHLKIGLKVIDEAHSSYKSINYVDCHSNIYKNIYLTATPSRSNAKEKFIFDFFHKEIPVFGRELFTEEKKYIEANIFLLNSKPTPLKVLKCKNRWGLDNKKYVKYCLSDELYYEETDGYNDTLYYMTECIKPKKNMRSIIYYTINTYKELDGKIVIILPTNDLIKQFQKDLMYRFNLSKEDVGLFCSLSKNKEKELEKKIILSTEKSMNKAKNVPDIRVLINTLSVNSDVLLNQIIGRLRRNDKFKVLYIGIQDIGIPNVKTHSKSNKNDLLSKCKTVNYINYY